jgi:hypothetical protein
MARWQAEKWKRHGYQGRELTAYSSGPDEDYANARAIEYVEALQKKGYALELIEGDGVHATKGNEQFVVCVAKKEH